MINPESLLANKLLLSRFLAAWNGEGWQAEGENDLAALIEEVFEPSFDYRADSALPPTRPYAPSQLLLEIGVNREAFPDLHLDVDLANMVAEGDRVVAWWKAKGTNSQPVHLRTDGPRGPDVDTVPGETELAARGVTIASIHEGRISSLEMIWSPASLLQQLAAEEPAGSGTSQQG